MTVPALFTVSEKPVADLAGADNVLFLGNALGTDTHLWDLALPTLAAKYSVVRFDMPGHGQSPIPTDSYTLEEVADALVAKADELGVEKFDYAGVSVSGAIALELANKYPERIKHSIVVCSAPYMGGPEGWAERIAQVSSSGTASLVPMLPPRWFSDGFIAKSPEAVKKVLNMVVATDDDSYIKTCEALGNYDARPFLSGITVPVLAISGEIDPGAPVSAGEFIKEGVPGADLVVIPGASHIAVVESPLEMAKNITDFLSK
ncbi:alpha/beta fold hydrolase [Aurantimicrobium minutum]|uniref:alpha/beta fold hydrolase n=1 Tax=Aurantimicrobium minutum TaxID=708131 RepID=UPI0024746A09|nr:alpha/beta fold hydrolase [Aurantimicrobium minutum]MDH6207121.1 3-oxoadipate enol-lactonase [Aurantimicrobium minutum]